MKEVYVVTTGSYSDYSIRAIFAKKADAELLASRLEDANPVETYQLSTLKDAKPTWLVWFYKNSAPEAMQNQCAVHGEIKELGDKPLNSADLMVGCRAVDEAEAIKVASDLRAEYLDRRLNP